MTTTGPAEDTPKIPEEDVPVDPSQVPDVALDDGGMGAAELPAGRRSIDELSPEEQEAARKAAEEMSVEEILGEDGSNNISRRVTGSEIRFPVGIDKIDGAQLLAKARDKAGDGLKFLERGLGFAKDHIGTLADGLKQSAKKEPEDKE